MRLVVWLYIFSTFHKILYLFNRFLTIMDSKVHKTFKLFSKKFRAYNFNMIDVKLRWYLYSYKLLNIQSYIRF